MNGIQQKTQVNRMVQLGFFVVRSTGIEDVRRYEKSLDFQGFFTIERQKFLEIIVILGSI